jgi:DNA invertase Pin-like site-specific DNA recombinase
MLISKIQAQHRQKMAYVYLRQSTMAQVYHHQESTQRQYALKDRALELGWMPDQIRVLDADLGLSGTQGNNRLDFQTLVADVSLEKVGAVFALEVSRLSRSCSDWHRLLEICSLTGTLIVDADGCYDPADFNDQLLLGLKGTMSQAELHFLRGRLQGGKRNKAQRGELRFPLPVGFVYGEESSMMVVDPDAEVQNAVRLAFSLFRQTGSAYGVVRHFLQHHLSFPRRAYGGVWKGKVLWGQLQHGRVLGLLSNPCYAGAYAFGRSRGVKSISTDGQVQSKIQKQPMDSWLVLIQQHHAGYISWNEYLENQQMLKQNQTNQPELCSSGAAREGRALLQGLLLCGHCGRRLSPRYTGNGGIYPVYECTRRQKDTDYSPDCVRLSADLIDQAVSQRILEILQPDQMEIAFRAVQELERRSQSIDQQWRMRLERLDYQAQLAQRRYEEVDPSNRLVAGTLERRWNEALQAKATALEELQQHRQQQGLELTEEQKGQLLALAKDFPQLWQSSSTAAQDRKRMLRLLIKDITVNRQQPQRKAVLHICWQGGAVEDLSIDIPLPAPDKVRYPEAVVNRVRALALSMNDKQIMAALNQEGLLSARGHPFTLSMIKWIRCRHAIPAKPSLKLPEELTVGEVARRFNVSHGVVYYWIEHHHLSARKLGPGLPIYIKLDPETETRLQSWVAQSNRIKQARSPNPAAPCVL